MEYTVNKLAQLSGVSGRTIRYYDQIGLLRPARINSSGYRIYGQKEVDRLQQILFYRELEISLEEIKNIINQPAFDQTAALKKHYSSLKKKRARLDQIIETVEKTIASQEGGISMLDEEKFEGFKEKSIQENEQKYGEEIREKYGDETVNASNKKWRGLSQEDVKKMNELEEEILPLLASGLADNSSSDIKQQAAAKHKEWLMYAWPSYSKEAHAGLAEMYVADERFTAYYDEKAGSGAAVFLRDAILNYLQMK